MDEIEVTEEMVEAGAKELTLCDSADGYDAIALAIYLAMEKARGRPSSCP